LRGAPVVISDVIDHKSDLGPACLTVRGLAGARPDRMKEKPETGSHTKSHDQKGRESSFLFFRKSEVHFEFKKFFPGHKIVLYIIKTAKDMTN
jgi:hypothetical protein